MNIFNSLGSNYNLKFTLKALFAKNNSQDSRLLKSYLARKYKGRATLTYKGHHSLYLALKSLNLPKNSSVAINSFTCEVVKKAVVEAGFKPHFLDIDPQTLNFTPHLLLKALKSSSDGSKIKAVIIQNTLGFPCNIKAIQSICKKHKLKLIEDLAHSTSQTSTADAYVLSFSQDKIIDAVSGGAVVTKKVTKSNLQNVSRLYQLRDKLYPLFTLSIRTLYPIKLGKPLHALLKISRLLSQPIIKGKLIPRTLPNWYASLVRIQLKNLDADIKHRRQIALVYAKNIDPKLQSAQLVSLINQSTNIRYPIFTTNRQSLFKYLKAHKIYITDTWYDTVITPSGQYPSTQLISSSIVNLPTHKKMTLKKAKRLSSLVNQWKKSQLYK